MKVNTPPECKEQIAGGAGKLHAGYIGSAKGQCRWGEQGLNSPDLHLAVLMEESLLIAAEFRAGKSVDLFILLCFSECSCIWIGCEPRRVYEFQSSSTEYCQERIQPTSHPDTLFLARHLPVH